MSDDTLMRELRFRCENTLDMWACEAGEMIELLRAEVATKDAKIQRLESRGISDMQQELKEKDKRIEELEKELNPDPEAHLMGWEGDDE